MQAQDIGEISIYPYLALALCTIGYLALASAYDIMSDISRSCACSQRCGDMLSAGSQSLALALALEDVSQRWLLTQRCLSSLGSQCLAHSAGSQRCVAMLSAGSQSLALALEDVSQRCLSALARSSALSLSAGLSALGSLRWLSALWRYAQHWLSVLGRRLSMSLSSGSHQKSNHVPYYLFTVIIRLGNMYYGVTDTFLT